VRTELLQYEVQVEVDGAATWSMSKSPPKNKTNLDKLLEMIRWQAELLDLKTTSSRPAEGTVIEASSIAARSRGHRAGSTRHGSGSATSSSPAPRWAAFAHFITIRA